MKTLNLIQGTPEWDAHRANPFMHNASDAPAMLGCDDKRTRSELMRERASGVKREFSRYVQERVLNKGHRNEAFARDLADRTAGVTFYPVTGVSDDGFMSASFDGLTMSEDVAWEHKSLNNVLRAVLPAEGIGDQEVGAALPKKYRVQMEQQLAVSGAERMLFMASNWTDDGELIEARFCWYYPDSELRAEIIMGWKLFDTELQALLADKNALAEFLARFDTPQQTETPQAMIAPVVKLRHIAAKVVGDVVVEHDLLGYKADLERLKSTPGSYVVKITDDATMERASQNKKELADGESALAKARLDIIAAIPAVNAAIRLTDELSEETRSMRLASEKLVDGAKKSLKASILSRHKELLATHVSEAAARIGYTPKVQADFEKATARLSSFDKMREKAEGELARCKVLVNMAEETALANLACVPDGTRHLFADMAELVWRDKEAFAAIAEQRITAERQRLQDAADAAAAAAREAAASEAKRKADEAAAEAQRKEEAAAAEAARQQQAAAAPQPDPVAPASTSLIPVRRQVEELPPQVVEEAATVRLGDICAALGVDVGGISMTAQFIELVLGTTHRATDKAAKLYTKSDAHKILTRLSEHAAEVAEQFKR